MSRLDHALELSRKGIPVFPCSSNKKPRFAGQGGFKSATTDETKIREWWEEAPDALIGVPTGEPSGLLVLDIDPQGLSWYGRNLSEFRARRVHYTRRGRHLVFRRPDAGIRCTTNRPVKGVDLRADGGYVIWWPAEGLKVKGTLEEVAEAPEWLMEAIRAPKKRSEAAPPRLHVGEDREGAEQRWTDVQSALEFIDPDTLDYDDWVKIPMAIHSEDSSQRGFELAEKWCQRGSRYEFDEVSTRWKGFSKEREEAVTVSTIFWRARQHGWQPPPGHDYESEDGVALSFASSHPDLRYVALWSKWMSWDGQCWATDTTLSVFDQVRAHVRSQSAKKPMLSARFIAGVERLAKGDRRYAATVDQWDSDDWLLNTPSGVVELKTGKLRPATPEEYLTKLTAAGPQAGCPLWEKTLLQITDCNVEYVAFLQRALGYALSGTTREHALFFFYGSGGNGKGVLLNTIQYILGSYAVVASAETFTASRLDRHSTELAMLQGARMVIAQETEEGREWAEARIKSLTGGDPITARYMRQDNFTFVPKFKLFISGNHKPKLRNVDEAMRRRLHVLPFTRTFAGEERDPELSEKLKSEAGGILQWLIEGCTEYVRVGLNPPPVVADATSEYFNSEDVFAQWVAECCEIGPEYWASPTELLRSFNDYARSINEGTLNARQLKSRLERDDYRAGNTPSKGGRYWSGIRVIPPFEEEGE